MSWVSYPAGNQFPIENLPYGLGKFPTDGKAHVCIAIGDYALSLKVLSAKPDGPLRVALNNDTVADSLQAETLNPFMAQTYEAWKAVRVALIDLLKKENTTLQNNEALKAAALVPQKDVPMLLPCEIGDYTDFYISRYHASNIGKMFRPNQPPLLENWLNLPVGYHGRSSSIVVSGTPIRRPNGQRRPVEGQPPVFGACAALDLELEMAIYLGTGNKLGEPIKAADANKYIFGYSLFNDWSARDLQKWEYVPLGPFLGKNFASTVGAWIVTPFALEPFAIDGPDQSEVPTLPYLGTNKNGTYDVNLTVDLSNKDGETMTISQSNMKYGYWAVSQMLAHHTCNGCNMRPGDMIATGTLSGPEDSMLGCMLEISWQGTRPVKFPSGQ